MGGGRSHIISAGADTVEGDGGKARSANTFLLCLWFDVHECLNKSEAAACDYMPSLRLPLLSDQIKMCGGTAPKKGNVFKCGDKRVRKIRW